MVKTTPLNTRLYQKQVTKLRQLVKSAGTSRSQVIRDLIDQAKVKK